jgi:hypothetical protein
MVSTCAHWYFLFKKGNYITKVKSEGINRIVQNPTQGIAVLMVISIKPNDPP